MERPVVIVLVVAIAAALTIGVGIYILVNPGPTRPTSPAGPSPTPPAVNTTVDEYTVPLEKGLTWGSPLLGPTTPLNDAYGGLWVINAAREGTIQMNLSALKNVVGEDPFAIGGDSLRLHIAADFGVTSTPLAATYYIVPAVDYAMNGTTGPAKRNGALALFAGSDFVAADPFNGSVFLRYTLPFVPTWTGEDPASAGDMLLAPAQPVFTVGVVSYPGEAFRYFYASDGNHTAVFAVSYVHAGYCPCAVPYGSIRFYANATLSAPPFLYYNEAHATASSQYRSGPGVAFVLPLANDSLEVVDTVGSVRGWVPLTLGGQPARVAGPIGFVRTSYPLELLLPVRSAGASGLVVLDTGTLSPVFEGTAGAATWQPVGAPLSRSGSSVYAAWYDPAAGRTVFLGWNGTGAPIAQAMTSAPGRARTFFQVQEVNALFAEMQDGGLLRVNTTYTGPGSVAPTLFPLRLPSSGANAAYAGSPGGTKYGTLLAAAEVFGAWTDSANATTALFHWLPRVTKASLEPLAFHVDAVLPAFPEAAAAPGLSSGRRT